MGERKNNIGRKGLLYISIAQILESRYIFHLQNGLPMECGSVPLPLLLVLRLPLVRLAAATAATTTTDGCRWCGLLRLLQHSGK